MIEGMEKAKETAKEPEYKKVPLTPEEEAYLNGISGKPAGYCRY